MIREKQISGMARSRNINDKKSVVNFLRRSFPTLEDKSTGWKILLKFLSEPNLFVKIESLNVIHLNIAYIPNEEEAWKCLLDLAQESNKKIRLSATVAMESVFLHLPDPENGWLDLVELVKTSVDDGNLYPLLTMPKCFDCLGDKENTLKSLEELTNHDNVALRSFSNNLVGRIYITKSVKAKSDAFNGLYFKGIDYLKKSYNDLNTPSHKFCYLMHNTFSKIIEGEVKGKDEIDDCMHELKIISGKSNEKTKIIQILDDLYIVLEETLEAQQKGEDISKFKDKIIPICTQLNVLIGTLDSEIIRLIAKKAQDKIRFEYACTIKALKIVDELIDSPVKLTSEPNLIIETIRLCCLSISEPVCNHYKSKLEEIVKQDVDIDKKRTILLQFIQELKPVLEQEKSLKEIIVSGHSEIKSELAKVADSLDNCFISLNRTGPRQEIIISTGVEMYGTGAQVITTIPLKEFGYDELQSDMLQIKDNMPFTKIPNKFKAKILEYIKSTNEK